MKTAVMDGPGPDEDPFAPTSEKRFQDLVVAKARRYGLLCYHTYDSRRSAPGFPDLVIAGPGGVAFRELKTENGRPSQAQMQWIHTLAAAGADAGIWRPHDLSSGLIEQTLARLCKPVQNGATS